jgi:hypothetical protein
VALRETSGDMMVAAERFFDGKYDYILDLPDDDDGEDDDASPSSSKAKGKVHTSGNRTLQPLIHVQARDSDDEDEDEKMQDDEDDGG